MIQKLASQWRDSELGLGLHGVPAVCWLENPRHKGHYREGFSSSLTMENLNAKLGMEILFTKSPQNGHSGLCQGCRFVFECHMAAGVNSYLPEYAVLNTLKRLQLHTAQSAWLGLHLLFTHFIPQLPRLFGCN